MSAPDSTAAIVAPRPVQRGIALRLLRRPDAVIALVVFAVILVACYGAPWLAPQDPYANDLTNTMQAPSAAHWLGTDQLGRDVLSRLMWGGIPSLTASLIVVVVALAISIPLGVSCGFLGGRFDQLCMRVVDLAQAMPVMVIILVVLAVFGGQFLLANMVLGLLMIPPVLRNVRGSAIAVRHELFVDAARVSGVSSIAIIFRHIVPRSLGPILVQGTIVAAMSLLFTAGLAYLGFGVTPPEPSWGSMIAEATTVLRANAWMLVAAGGVLALTIGCLSVLGDAIRDVSVEAWAQPVRRRAHVAARPVRGLAAGDATLPLLRVSGLSVAYRGRTAVDGVDFELPAGSILGIVGESGSGKTTVARAVLGLLRGGGEITGGEILFRGTDLAVLDDREMRRLRGTGIAYISQEPMVALDPTMRVGAILRDSVRLHRGSSRADAEKRALELLRLVQIADPERVARLYPHQISGGMAQRVSIARALVADPALLIADEPTTALDVTVQAEILDLLRELRERLRMSIFIVTHDWGVVAALCDRALVMRGGRVVEEGPYARLYDHPRDPYTAMLIEKARRLAETPAADGPVPAEGGAR
ncbi:MAG: dipeptide/oligopeptide/nickel ABC transporter permease/ATP-binding protein [Microbacterium sp.]|uniref:dipeptide/oligopeptide/nickel ABC transporter permease/ATP-binding protein n=1 Tax=Microbacterium sp. TaxID=51671 RepID=UPI0039E6BF57